LTQAVSISRIQGFAFRSPIAKPVETSFGIMRDRPAVFVRIEDDTGAFGWGEVFANWPAAAAEHRINLLERDIAPLVLRRAWARPDDMFRYLAERTHVVALQSGEWGPFRQVIAGLDIALWDLFARRNGQTLRHFLNADAPNTVPAYASGIDIRQADTLVPKAREIGFRTFKVKVGFDPTDDLKRLHGVFAIKHGAEAVAADANQGWDLDAALDFTAKTTVMPLVWLEEPLRADAAKADWEALAQASPHALAGGENLVGFAEFDAAIKAANLRVFQPDIIKWGGITGCLRVGRKARDAGLRYCPHFLGGGIGLQASANLLAAVGGDGLLEVDVNPNPLRDAFGPVKDHVYAGLWRCNDAPGIGVLDLPADILSMQSHRVEIVLDRSN
jgi:L-alanine-DL-glutamate epimerase-like enolase superfamily enzyme